MLAHTRSFVLTTRAEWAFARTAAAVFAILEQPRRQNRTHEPRREGDGSVAFRDPLPTNPERMSSAHRRDPLRHART